jgi:hypothetical protein
LPSASNTRKLANGTLAMARTVTVELEETRKPAPVLLTPLPVLLVTLALPAALLLLLELRSAVLLILPPAAPALVLTLLPPAVLLLLYLTPVLLLTLILGPELLPLLPAPPLLLLLLLLLLLGRPAVDDDGSDDTAEPVEELTEKPAEDEVEGLAAAADPVLELTLLLAVALFAVLLQLGLRVHVAAPGGDEYPAAQGLQ